MTIRAGNEGPQSFHNHGDWFYYGLFLVKSAYLYFNIEESIKKILSIMMLALALVSQFLIYLPWINAHLAISVLIVSGDFVDLRVEL